MAQTPQEYFFNPVHEKIASARYLAKKDGHVVEGSIFEAFDRVVKHVCKKEDVDYANRMTKWMRDKCFMPGGRILSQSGIIENLYNCFVLGIGDSREEISEAQRIHFHVQSHGGGTGFNFSRLRPAGSWCEGAKAHSSGPEGFITEFSGKAANIQQGGNRSGANMGILEDWHPSLFNFVSFKSTHNWENIRKFSHIFDEKAFAEWQWNNHYPWQMFNVSVGLSDEFMKQVMDGSDEPWQQHWEETNWYLWDIEYEGKLFTVSGPNEKIAYYNCNKQIPYFNGTNKMKIRKGPYSLPAKVWFQMICARAWEDGCPGIFFMGMARRFHNGEYCNPLEATNPCGEQILPAWSVCCLSSLVLPSFWDKNTNDLDWDEFKMAIHDAIRFLDDVIDVSKTGVDQIDERTALERRIGLGTTGAADLLILAKKKYSSQEGRDFIDKVLSFLRNESYSASINLAKSRGSFPWFDFEGFSQSEFFKTLPLAIRLRIREHGIRNVTLNTQAPVGTTGTILGYSTGCEPHFALSYTRNSNEGSFQDGCREFIKWQEENPGNTDIPDYFETAHDISPEDHILMQAVFARNIDSSVSKTINLPGDATVEDIHNAYTKAYALGIKSTTIYRDGSKQQILESKEKTLDRFRHPNDAPSRPKSVPCRIYETKATVNENSYDWYILVGMVNDHPYEIFAILKNGTEIKVDYGNIVRVKSRIYNLLDDDGNIIVENIVSKSSEKTRSVSTECRRFSMELRHGIPIKFIAEQISKSDEYMVAFSKCVARILKKFYSDRDIQLIADKAKCCQCNSNNINLVMLEGCEQITCLDCGDVASKCV